MTRLSLPEITEHLNKSYAAVTSRSLNEITAELWGYYVGASGKYPHTFDFTMIIDIAEIEDLQALLGIDEVLFHGQSLSIAALDEDTIWDVIHGYQEEDLPEHLTKENLDLDNLLAEGANHFFGYGVGEVSPETEPVEVLVQASKTGDVPATESQEFWLVRVAAPTDESGRAFLANLIKRVSPHIPSHEISSSEVRVNFIRWEAGNSSTSSFNRTFPSYRWEDVNLGYAKDTRRNLNEIVSYVPPDLYSAKIFLLHGLPGTGKTSFIRTLASEWAEWANLHYVLDPEYFFGVPKYITDAVSTFHTVKNPKRFKAKVVGNQVIKKNNPPTEYRWNVFVLEDCDEFLMQDSKDRTGQGLSRLLNVADGIFGQGLPNLFVITTNADITTFHPAVVRDGRCAARVNFEKMSFEESLAWAKATSDEESFSQLKLERKEYTLAEIAALVRARQTIASEVEDVSVGVYL